MLSPKNRKFKYSHVNNFKGIKEIKLSNQGYWGLIAETRGIITAVQLEAARQAISKRIKKIGKTWIRIFPYTPFSKKASETRMGSGKGSIEYWGAIIIPGCILFELSDVHYKNAKNALRAAAFKLPIKTKIIQKL
nr:ribosomal protein L16 [Coccidia sp. AB-2023a]